MARATLPCVVASALLAAAAVLGTYSPASAFHTVFHYQVDRIEIDGNSLGPLDGVPDFVDDFDGDTLAPLWTPLLGTAYEQGGFLHLSNPGTHYFAGFPLDISEVQGTTVLTNGAGSFTVSSAWAPNPVTSGNFIHMTLWLSGPPGAPWEFFGVDANNFPGQGPQMTQHLYRYVNGVYEAPSIVNVPYDPAAVSGEFVLRMSFDDTTKLAQASFSLDGGVTFESPFAPVRVFNDGADRGIVLLGADPMAAPLPVCGNGIVEQGEVCDPGGIGGAPPSFGGATCASLGFPAGGTPTCAPDCKAIITTSQCSRTLAQSCSSDGDCPAGETCNAGCWRDACKIVRSGQTLWVQGLVSVRRGAPGRDRLSLKAQFAIPNAFATLNPGANGMSIVIGNGAGGDALMLAIPPGANWVAQRRRWLYRDPAGSVGGVRKIEIGNDTWGGVPGVKVSLTGKNGSYPLAFADLPIAVTVLLGDASAGQAGACGRRSFDAGSCSGNRGGTRLVCQ